MDLRENDIWWKGVAWGHTEKQMKVFLPGALPGPSGEQGCHMHACPRLLVPLRPRPSIHTTISRCGWLCHWHFCLISVRLDLKSCAGSVLLDNGSGGGFA